MASRALGVVGWVISKIFYALWSALIVVVPLFGFWLASSLAAYKNASQWLSLLIGLALFPILPVGWQLFAAWRRSRQADANKQILTGFDLLVLRTLLVTSVFLGVMYLAAPSTAFRALAVRGDWIVDDHHGPIAEKIRSVLLGIADVFEKRWHHHSDELGDSDKAPEPSDHQDPVPTPTPTPVPTPTPTPTPSPTPSPTPTKPPADPNGWPLATEPDARVTSMSAELQTSPESVGTYLGAQFTDKRQLVKAMHDYVILRVTYDKKTLEHSGDPNYARPSQQAKDVFATKTGVCEGYARLMVALGKAAGVEVKYITGFIRDAGRGAKAGEAKTDAGVKAALEGFRHAWNAVKIDGTWLLVDATWDDQDAADDIKHVESTYLFTPANLFVFDHLPEDRNWQLLDAPLGAGDFARQPLLSPRIGVLGVKLVEPTRSQITVSGEATIVLDNPYHVGLMAGIDAEMCSRRDDGTRTTFTCEVPDGEHAIELFGALDPDAHRLTGFGTVIVNSR